MLKDFLNEAIGSTG